ncbi:BatD family protein [Tichowtungia aerotolerans]|uniref:Protein BatD n=1 Tax=Tichowtungia aerotolerans TaxID=2697043 RepID=A0A6P1M1Z5_9BACT|nr:BatD family protein [Tichowtungia aerotolerans]QHI68610.1 hypothetical protein GT409_03810 [Tichowtungia aerotolerans]
MKNIRYWLLVIGLVCNAQAELSVTLAPEEASRFIYEPFRLLLQADKEIERPEIPSGTNWSVTGMLPVENGFRIELIANESGMLTLPPFTVTAGEEHAQTPLLRLAVAAPRPAHEMELLTAFSTTNPVVGQPIELTVTWKTGVPFPRCQELQFSLPLLRNPDWEVYPTDPGVPEKNRIGLPVNAQRIIAKNEPNQLQFFYRLVPRRAGTFASSARLNCALMETLRSSSQYPSYFDNHFFNIPDKKDRFERIYLSVPETELTVQPLPAEGRTVRYSGIVGNCAASARIEPSDTVVGQPMLLTVTLTNLTFGGHIRNLPEATLDGLGSEFGITREPMHVRTAPTAKSFTYIVRPLRSGLTVLPALALQIFDPAEQSYQTIRSEPLPITVEPNGEQTVYTPSQQQEPLTPLSGIRHNRKESEPTMYAFLEFLAADGWIFWLLPLLLWPALLPWLRRRDRCRTDPAYARAAHARSRFRKKVVHDEESAWKNYLADRFNLTAEAVTFDAVRPHLQDLDPELLQAVRNRFKAEETDHYAPPGTPAQKTATIRHLVRKLEKAVPVFLLMIALFPTIGKAAPVQAETLFEQAMKIRAEKPDQAAPLFTEAALEFETDRQFFNAANSWFFAGENGRALANYRAAQNRRPFDRQIRDSIHFIRAQRSSLFQTSEKPGHRLSNGWKNFCTWSPALRFGALTLLYLIGWAVFLAARIFGKTVPRKAWITLGVIAAGPALSLIWSFFQPSEGVVIQPTDARLGPGYAYEKAYEGLLQEAIEFQWLEKRGGWVLARLPDESEAWLRETACVKVQ